MYSRLKFVLFSRCGANYNHDDDFKISIEDVGEPKFKHIHCGYGYGQNAWSYGTENFIMPLSS